MEDKLFLDLDRLPVFIGKQGSTKKQFEEKFNSKIEVNSKTGEIVFESEDSVDGFVLSNIIHAINHGHSPEHALLLEDENTVFDIIDVKSQLKDPKRLKSVLGRIIGKEGATRRTITQITKCEVAIKDNFVSFIGPYENIALVHEAIEMLIQGASHKALYGYLERNKVGSESGLI